MLPNLLSDFRFCFRHIQAYCEHYSKAYSHILKTSKVDHCCQIKFESLLKPHLHYGITWKFQTEVKNETDF